MSEGDDPWLLVAVAVRLFQVLLQPVVLVGDLLPSVVHIKVVFGRERDEVRLADVERVEVVVLATQTVLSARVDHCKSVVVVREVAIVG